MSNLTACVWLLATMTSLMLHFPVIAWPLSDGEATIQCPVYCHCSADNGSPLHITVQCNCSNCTTIPSPIPENTYHLNISGVSLGNVDHSTLRLPEFKELEILDMSHCQINNISIDAFVNTPKLRTLKLENNNLSTLFKESFEVLLNLEHIDLSHNNLDCTFETAKLKSVIPGLIMTCNNNRWTKESNESVLPVSKESILPVAEMVYPHATATNLSAETDSWRSEGDSLSSVNLNLSQTEVLEDISDVNAKLEELDTDNETLIDNTRNIGFVDEVTISKKDIDMERSTSLPVRDDIASPLEGFVNGNEATDSTILKENGRRVQIQEDVISGQLLEDVDRDETDSTTLPLINSNLSLSGDVVEDVTSLIELDDSQSANIGGRLVEFVTNKDEQTEITSDQDENDSLISADVVGDIISAIGNGVRQASMGPFEDSEEVHVDNADEVLSSSVGPSNLQIGIFVFSIALLIASAIMMYFIYKLTKETDAENDQLYVPLSKIPYVLVKTEEQK